MLLALSITLETLKYLPSFIPCFISNPIFSPEVPLVLSMQQTKTHTHNLNLLSAVRVMIIQSQRERKKEKGELRKVLQAVQRFRNACVYLLLPGKGCHDEDRTKHTWTTYGDRVTTER